jgi:hypothetical protein
VACHQTVALPLLKAGHPELIFELDGQSVSQPKHWRESTNTSGAQVWLVGQAVALREMSWQLSQGGDPDEKLIARWNALLWLLRKLNNDRTNLPLLPDAFGNFAVSDYSAIWQASQNLAKQVAAASWTEAASRAMLEALLSSADDF